MRALSQRVHIARARAGEHRRCRDTPPRTARPRHLPGSLWFLRREPAYQPTRLRSSTALRCSLRRSRTAWSQEARITNSVKKITRPRQKKVIDLVVGLAVEALAVVAREGGGGRDQPGREEEEGSQLPHAGGTIPCRSEWPIPSSASSRSRREAATSTSTTTSRRDQARPFPVLVGRLSDRLRLHPGHALARRRPARRDGAGVRADLPGLHDRGEADRPVPDGGRPGHRRQGARRAAHRPGLEHAGDARRGIGPAARTRSRTSSPSTSSSSTRRWRSTAGTRARTR